jgi:hypothetical protein
MTAHPWRSIALAVALLLAAQLSAAGAEAHADACTIQWVGEPDEDDPPEWSTPGDWQVVDPDDDPRAPNRTDLACIPGGVTLEVRQAAVTGGIATGGTVRIVEEGSLEWTGTQPIEGGGRIEVKHGGELRLTSGSVHTVAAGHTIRNEGRLDWRAGSLIVRSGARIENHGTLDARAGGQTMATPAGERASFTNTGEITRTPGDRDSGLVQLRLPVDNDGVVDVTAGTVNLHGDPEAVHTGTFGAHGEGTLVLAGGRFHGDGASVTGPTTLTAADLGGPLFTIYDLLTWNGAGSLDGSGGRTVVAAGGTLRVVGSAIRDLGAGHTLRNEGTIDWRAATIVPRAGSLIENMGTLDARANNSIVPPVGELARLHNTGRITRTTGEVPSDFAQINVPVDNDGVVDIVAGHVRLRGDADAIQTGRFGASQIPASLTLADGSFVTDGATIDHRTILDRASLGGPRLTITGTLVWAGGGDLVGSGGTTLVAETGTLESLSGSPREIGPGHTLRNEGMIAGRGGTIRGREGAVLENAGTLEMLPGFWIGTAPDEFFRIHNRAGIRRTGEGAAPSTLMAPVDNDGEIHVESGTVFMDQLRQSATGRVRTTVRRAGPGSEDAAVGVVDVNALWLAGELVVETAGDFQPRIGDVLEVVRHRMREGTFERISGPVGADRTYRPVYGTGRVTLEVDAGPPVRAVAITSGPPTLTNSSSARFEFVAIGPPATGRFECSLDGGAWAECSSGHEYRRLSDRDHVFRVRFVLAGQAADDAPATERTWTSDTFPPSAHFVNPPSGILEVPDVTLTFASDDPRATFRCSFDGGAEFACSSGWRLVGLADGGHVFRVRAVDPAGNEQLFATEASWRVRRPPAPPPDCNGEGRNTYPIGVLTVVVRSGPCLLETSLGVGKSRLETSGVVALNGVEIHPNGAKVILDVKLTDVVVRFTGPVQMRLGSVSWSLPQHVELPVTRAGNVASYALDRLGKLQKKLTVAGLAVRVKPTFELTKDNGGSTKIGLTVELPTMFREVPTTNPIFDELTEDSKEKPGGLSGTVTVNASNNKGVFWSGKLTLQRAHLFGKLVLEDISLGYDDGQQVFEGTATVARPDPRALDPTDNLTRKITAKIQVGPGGAFGLLRGMSIQASRWAVPWLPGVYIQRFGADMRRTEDGGKPALSFTGSAGISIGPRVNLGRFKGEPISIDAKLKLTVSDDITFEASGEGKILEASVGTLSAAWTYGSNRVDLKGEVGYDIAGYGVHGQIVDAWWDVRRELFNLEAKGAANFPAPLDRWLNGEFQALYSNRGRVVCYGPPDRRIGYVVLPSGRKETFANSCDVGPYRVAATASTATAATTLSVRRGSRLAVIAAESAAGAPDVQVQGPSGIRLDTTAAQSAAVAGPALIVKDAAERSTHIVLRDPPPGAWTVTPAAPGVRVRVADGLRSVRVSARVRRQGARRVLSWRHDAGRGERVMLVERAGGANAVVKVGAGRRGRVAFMPQRAGQSRRQIVALVTRGGLPRASTVVARFSASTPVRARRARGLRRRGATVSWRRDPGARSYEVAVTAGRRTVVRSVQVARLKLPRGMARRRITVAVAPVGYDGRVAPAVRKALAKPRRARR